MYAREGNILPAAAAGDATNRPHMAETSPGNLSQTYMQCMLVRFCMVLLKQIMMDDGRMDDLSSADFAMVQQQ